MEVALAVATLLLWTTLLLMHQQLPAGTSEVIGLGALLCLVATFVVSDRGHTTLGVGPSLARIVALIVLFVALLWIGYLLLLGWGMRGWTF